MERPSSEVGSSFLAPEKRTLGEIIKQALLARMGTEGHKVGFILIIPRHHHQ